MLNDMSKPDLVRFLAITLLCKTVLEKLPEPRQDDISGIAFKYLIKIAAEADTLPVAEDALRAIIDVMDEVGNGDAFREKINLFQGIYSDVFGIGGDQ